jgi:hypothetical protein
MFPRMNMKQGVKTATKMTVILRPKTQPAFICGVGSVEFVEIPSLMKIESSWGLGCIVICENGLGDDLGLGAGDDVGGTLATQVVLGI